MHYIEHMFSARVPVIFEFSHLARLLGRTSAYLASVVNSAESHYRHFVIPKRRGGEREIAAPYPALLECQQWVNNQILRRAKLHPAVHGFRRRRSIKSNAEKHLNKAHLLKMDLADFFPSITLRRVIHVFRQFGYAPNVSFYLARLCCLHDVLPQGAATSPALSNIVATCLDSRLSGLAGKYNLQYTRYADDLTFSGERIPISFPEIVKEIVSDAGFSVRDEKTRLCRSEGKRVVTGVSVSGEKVQIPRRYKRKLRQEVHYILRFGYLSHTSKRKIRDPFYLDSVYGRLMFWRWVEPDNEFAADAAERILRLQGP